MSPLILALLMQISTAYLTPAETTLVFAGDAMMHQAQIDAARRSDGTYDYSDCFSQIKPYIEAADYAVVNLETPLSDPPYSGYPCFNAPASYADALSDCGFDLLLTANNHTLDRRDKGLKNTISTLDAKQIEHIGTYSDRTQRDSVIPFIKEINGIKIGFLNYTYGTNGFSVTSDALVDYINRRKIAEDVAATRARGAELIAVAIHWGEEYKLLPEKSQRDMADYLLSLGVDMIIGGHPHVIQPMEMRMAKHITATNDTVRRPAFVCYSLGNLISNMRTTDTRGGALARVTVKRDSTGQAVVDRGDYRLIYVLPKEAGRPNYMVYPAEAEMPDAWSERRDAFVTNATRIFDRHNISVTRDTTAF